MNKKENRMAVRQAAQQAVIRDEQNHRIEHAATNPIKEVLKSLHTTLRYNLDFITHNISTFQMIQIQSLTGITVNQ